MAKEKPFLTLTSRDFQSGIAPSAHSEGQGLFYKADGITSINEPGVDQSANNGFLMCGAAATTVSGSITGSIIGGTTDLQSSSVAYFMTDGGHVYSLTLDNTFGTSLGNLRTIANTTSGIEVGSEAVHYVYYFQVGQIGRYDVAGVSFTDAWNSLNAEYIHATHKFNKNIYFGNGAGKIGSILSDGTFSSIALATQTNLLTTDISDDGTYVIIAATDNQLCDTSVIADTRIFFWDGATTNTWVREFRINDPFIYCLEKTPFGVFAVGSTGIWQVSFGGVKKVYSRSPGVYSVAHASAILYGRRAASFYINALLWGGVSGSNKVIKTFGQLDLAIKSSTIYPFLSTAGKNITFVDGQMLKGYVFVGDDTPQLKAYPFSTANIPQTGLTAQTVYIKLPQKTEITRIDLIFGVPLASGDSITASILTDEATAATSYGSATFAADGAIRRKQLIPSTAIATADEQMSLKLVFNAGAVKLKSVEFYGKGETP